VKKILCSLWQKS